MDWDWRTRTADTLCEIVPGVYLSSYSVSQNKQLLLDAGITHVINASMLGNPHTDCFTYLTIQIEDDHEADIFQHFSKSSRFICDALVHRGKVLVNCLGGISRSPTLVIAFLIRKRRMQLEHALKLVIQKRPRVDPNEGFLQQLAKWEKQHQQQQRQRVSQQVKSL